MPPLNQMNKVATCILLPSADVVVAMLIILKPHIYYLHLQWDKLRIHLNGGVLIQLTLLYKFAVHYGQN